MTARHIELLRQLLICALLLAALHWQLGDWFESIETRLWLLDVTGNLR